MPVTRGGKGRSGRLWWLAAAGLSLAGSAGAAGAQGTDGFEAGTGTVPSGERSAAAADGKAGDEPLFAGGPVEPGVLSAEGTLIKLDGRALQPRKEGDAVAALVASATGAAQGPEPGRTGDAEPAEDPPGRPPGLLRKLGGFFGLGRD